ncbi:Starch-binding associating with outer membrane [Cnuella takakiae]|uniref:Starch-binding associating with outer membrane n=1 Tax=Cnuella takakiae TaxID=1302690 RepID=A0A1M5CNR8_9BACT|nr:RagB/SusD family nutrient uptake outer membrane protein [Cnuella takakiae]OLY91891.1 RagB/SusD family nutrient uptake outer membrane protein [Cnuella takakiae]SHF56360.1 Starch-binding associating with outer membrane [Cnuella takakiae]
MKPIIFSLAALLLITGCSKLEEDPASFLTTGQFYNDEKQATAAVNGAYRKLYESGQSLYNSLFQIGVEMATDDYVAGPRARNPHVRAISGLTHDASNDRMEQLWKQSYDAINASNIVVDRVAQIADDKISGAGRARIINEARFLRALHYFNLVRWFGPVPVVLHEATSPKGEDLYVEKATEDAVYQQIIQDLTAAEALPATYGGADVGRATSGAAKSLLAKVYLTRRQWPEAAAKSKEVIDAGTYGLFTDFADVFNTATKNGREHIFSAQFRGNFNYQGNSLASRSAPANIPGINGDYADAIHRPGGLYESFTDNDRRKSVTFVTQMVSPADGKTYNVEPHFFKYYDPAVVGNQGQSSKNLPIIRYAEVLLIYAEALNEASGAPTAQAYWAIDEVRRRAGIAPLQDIAPALSQAQFRDSVFQERRKELVYEYQRWFDLVRRGADYYVTTLKAAGKTTAAPKHLHFPTPQRELNLNPKLTQHPDWK